MTMFRTKKLGKVKASIAIALGVVLLWGGLYLVGQQFIRTMSAIIPGWNARPSKSMELTDYVFKGTKVGRNQDGTKRIEYGEWHIRLPRAFVFSERGSQNNVSKPTRNKSNNQYFLNITALMDLETGELTPDIFEEDWQKRHRNGVRISLTNGIITRYGFRRNICDDLRKNHIKGRASRDSGRRDVRCGYRSNPHRKCNLAGGRKGWITRYSLPQKLFDPQHPKFELYCKAIDNFLDEITINATDMKQ